MTLNSLYMAKTITFIFTLVCLVGLIAAVLVTSKYEIRIIKENGKIRFASCFTHGIFVDFVVHDVIN